MVLLIISFQYSLFVFDLCYNRILIHQIAYEYGKLVKLEFDSIHVD